jgi:dihydroxy-acid dehydratase
MVELDVQARRIELCISGEELRSRLAGLTLPPLKYERGYGRMFLEHVTQADEGCDFDFLRGKS